MRYVGCKTQMVNYLGRLVLATTCSAVLIVFALVTYCFWANMNVFRDESLMMLVMFLQSLFLFLIPLFFYRNGRKIVAENLSPKQLSWTKRELKTFAILTVVCIVGSMLLGQLSEFVVKALPPSWGIETEDSVSKLLLPILKGGTPIYVSVFVICLVPAIVEELFFRATIQRYLLIGIRNVHFAIFLGATFFSLIHFSCIGFLSRLCIGLILGYAYHHSKKLSIPIAIHFINNLIALILLLNS